MGSLSIVCDAAPFRAEFPNDTTRVESSRITLLRGTEELYTKEPTGPNTETNPSMFSKCKGVIYLENEGILP